LSISPFGCSKTSLGFRFVRASAQETVRLLVLIVRYFPLSSVTGQAGPTFCHPAIG
jgi:hypothetical protein